MSTLVLTAIGDDRPGLVDALSGAITAHGGSWEESRMARLGGKFAGIVAVELPEQQVAGLRAALAEIGGLRITVDGAGDEPAPGGARVVLHLLGSDQPGLVHAVSEVIAEAGASIEELSTALRDAPMAGGTMFEATATVLLPADLAIEELAARLEDVAAHLMVDLEISG